MTIRELKQSIKSPLAIDIKPAPRTRQYIIMMLDASDSMNADGKIQGLNYATRSAIQLIQQIEADNPNLEIYLRAIVFRSKAEWLNQAFMPIKECKWDDLTASGQTAMGQAIAMLSDPLSKISLDQGLKRFSIILLSDGQPTDDFNAGLQQLMSHPIERKTLRLAIAIGKDADRDVLARFIGNPNRAIIEANNPGELEAALKQASKIATSLGNQPALPALPPARPTIRPSKVVPYDPSSGSLVW